ncbi:MAG: ribonuclease HII [Patescibacteria group bacterium]|nr:ribonuclease HII [Patescibacteria group bacterium]
MDKKPKYIVGIDEVGRGPIAGPVAVCSFIITLNNYESLINNGQNDLKIKIKDSKKLSKKQREKWYEYLKNEKNNERCNFFVSYVSAENIDKFGIVKAINKSLETSLLKIVSNPKDTFVYLDGGLRAPEQFIYQETVIKGDELHPVISFASIVAKVSRDKVMYNYSKEYPKYSFENHVGYGTKAHYEAIKKYGVLDIHRKSFLN